ncbi:GntR family transcriptional regulator [Brevibacillus choshinensis]|uniref:GntR family transcriptional regulator n=1 Tax=Brevibacillus choshinensis TaxID=54911 RepID=UPI002E2516B5|nr:GntR family transcriptional regulator [Brevibacillus choshinensis]
MATQTKRKRIVSKDYAFMEIKQRIINGELAPGQPLVEENLTIELEISRTPLREALQRLEMEELVVRQPNGRLRVASISKKEVEEIFVARSILEGIIAGQVAKIASEQDIQNLTDILRMIKAGYENSDYEEIIYYGSEFHSCLYEISGNKTIVKILSMLNDHIQRYRQLFQRGGQERTAQAVIEHTEILEKIIAKDSAAAEMAMRNHIQCSLETLLANIDNLQNDEQ